MQLSADARIPFARPLVFATYRDKLVELVPFLPNVRAIEVKERKDDAAVTSLVNVWHGGGEIPAAARAFLSEAMLSWTDRATWNESDFTTKWTIETHAFTEAVRCTGTNRYFDDGASTRLEIRGELSIDGAKLRGVPRLLAGSVSRAVEDFLVKKIGPNLLQVSDGVTKYLQEQKA